jgi:hypothetical protein
VGALKAIVRNVTQEGLVGSSEIWTNSDSVSSRSGLGDVVCLYCYTCVVSVCNEVELHVP